MEPRRLRRSGFTLIELLAAIGILGLLLSLAIPMIGKAKATANLNACQQNLHSIAGSLSNWAQTRNHGNWPKESGIKFLLVLMKDGEISPAESKVFTCPGTNDTTFAADDNKPGSGFKDWDALDKNCISYAGRDAKSFPVNKNREGEEVIAADDNDGRPNHNHVTNIVYADSRIDTVDIKDFKAELPENAEWIPVGPESPSDALKKLLIE